MFETTVAYTSDVEGWLIGTLTLSDHKTRVTYNMKDEKTQQIISDSMNTNPPMVKLAMDVLHA